MKYPPLLSNSLSWPFLIKALILIFPSVILSVPRGSAVFIVLFLLAIGQRNIWSIWPNLWRIEKVFLWGLFSFFILALLSTLVNGQVLSHMGSYSRFLLAIPIFLLLRSLNVSWLKVLSVALVLGAWTLCSQAIYQVEILGTGRAYGTKNPIIYGEFSMMVGALLVLRGALYRCNSRWQQIIFFGSAMAALSASYLSGSRGAWIFLPVFVGLLLVIYRQYLRGRVLLGVIVLLLGLFSTLWQFDGVQKRFKRVASEISLYQTNPERLTSVGARLEMWRASLNIWQNNPLLGTGAGDYAADMKSLHEAGKLHAYHPVFNTHAHSIYFHVLAMNGLLGLTALLLTLFIIPLWLVRRTSGNHDEALFVRWGGTTVVLAGMVFGLTEHWLGWNAMTSAYLLFLLIFITTKEVRPDD